jgi:hypothetical protein
MWLNMPFPLKRLHWDKRVYYIYTYHSRFIHDGVAEASQIFLRDAYILSKLFSYE